MSVDLFLYSPRRDVPTRRQLWTLLEKKGWQVLFVSDWPNTTIAEEGRLSNDLLIGCENAEGIAEVRALLSKGDVKAVDALLGQERFGNCALSIESPCEVDEDQIAETAEAIGKEAAGLMRQARTLYSLTWKGASTGKSGYLANEVWRILGKLCGGLLEDPQTGEGFIASAEEDSG